MKTIKLHYTGFWSNFDPNNNMFTYILRKRYNVEFDSVDPDFLICSPLGKPYDYMAYDCPRIMYSGEFLAPDFSAIDYFIGFDDIVFGDRNFRFPLYLWSSDGKYARSEPLREDEAVAILKQKDVFCNYIFGHDTALGKREEILERLSEYKRVDCCGRHRNNMPDGKTFSMANKSEFMKRCKFSITAESVCYPGFVSEKICDAFRAFTIPIYYGAPDVNKDINVEAFVNCYDYDSIDLAIKKVIELDTNDDMYIDMLCKYRYNVADYEENMFKALEQYLYNIFDQSKEEAYRRPRFYRAGFHEEYLNEYRELVDSISYKVWKKTKI